MRSYACDFNGDLHRTAILKHRSKLTPDAYKTPMASATCMLTYRNVP